MRRWVVLAVCVAAGAGAAALAAPRLAPWWRERALRQAPSRPDVLLITLDTTRADRLGCYGGDPAVSPALDALARGGVLFRRAYSHVPTTLASHASLLTGVTPARHGIHENGTFVLDGVRPTLAEAFQRAGYRTGAFVSTIVLDRRYGLARGFGDYVDELETDESELVMAQVRAEVTAERALSFLAHDDPRPAFAWVHFYDPHEPYAPPEPFASRFAGRAYDGEIASMDAQIGRLLEAVAKRGRPTIVAAVADHGESLGEHQEPTHAFFVYGATQHVPLILSYPGVLPAGREVQPLVRVVDVLPTLLEAARLPVPDDLDGRSLLPLVTGRSDRETGPAYQESYGPRLWWGAQEILGVRTGPWFYVRAPRPELYNVEDDPAETVNLAAERPVELERLQALLRSMVPEGDPLAHRASVDPETARTLRSLGYLGGADAQAFGTGEQLADPKDVAPILQDIAQAQGFVNRRDYERALAAFQALAAKMPRSTMIRGRAAKMLLALKRYDEAFAAYRALRDEQPTDEGHWIGMARARFHGGRPEEALAIVREGLAKFPDSTTLHENAGVLLEALKRLPEAEAAYRRSAELGPREPRPQLALASIADKRGRTDDAAVLFAKVVELSPHSRQGRQAGRRLGAIAETFARERRLPEAGAAYRAAVASGEAGPAVYLNAALVVFQLGARDESLGLLQEGAGRFPQSADLQYRLGRVLADRGARAEAETAFTRALAIDPARQDARTALERLRGQASR
ncbi:MAG: sulfatase-like hydrolase/transferase [Vicinamibacteria bacterium]